LPEQQQEDLITIVKKRLIEKRREALAKNIREARDDYARGEVKEGDVSDLMNGQAQGRVLNIHYSNTRE